MDGPFSRRERTASSASPRHSGWTHVGGLRAEPARWEHLLTGRAPGGGQAQEQRGRPCLPADHDRRGYSERHLALRARREPMRGTLEGALLDQRIQVRAHITQGLAARPCHLRGRDGWLRLSIACGGEQQVFDDVVQGIHVSDVSFPNKLARSLGPAAGQKRVLGSERASGMHVRLFREHPVRACHEAWWVRPPPVWVQWRLG